jgi:hypothetical protein
MPVMDAYVSKPTRTSELFSTIESVLPNKDSNATSEAASVAGPIVSLCGAGVPSPLTSASLWIPEEAINGRQKQICSHVLVQCHNRSQPLGSLIHAPLQKARDHHYFEFWMFGANHP